MTRIQILGIFVSYRMGRKCVAFSCSKGLSWQAHVNDTRVTWSYSDSLLRSEVRTLEVVANVRDGLCNVDARYLELISWDGLESCSSGHTRRCSVLIPRHYLGLFGWCEWNPWADRIRILLDADVGPQDSWSMVISLRAGVMAAGETDWTISLNHQPARIQFSVLLPHSCHIIKCWNPLQYGCSYNTQAGYEVLLLSIYDSAHGQCAGLPTNWPETRLNGKSGQLLPMCALRVLLLSVLAGLR